MKKYIIDTILFFSRPFYSKKRYEVNVLEAKANLGCGLHCLKGWENVDGSLTALFGSKKYNFINKALYKFAGSSAHYPFDYYNNVIQKIGLEFYDLRFGVPFQDSSLDVIYSSHFLEHLKKGDGRKFLEECHRTLKSGGLMRIVVPDLDVAFKMYKDGRVEDMLDSFFYNSDHYDFHSHKYNYNFEYLKSILSAIGFINITKEKYQKGKCPGIDYLDIYPDISLYIECKK